RRSEADARLASLSRQGEEQGKSRDEASSRTLAAAEACEEARRISAAASERLRTLSDAATRFGGRHEAVGYILTRAVDEGIRARGVVADSLRAGAEVERAAEGYLSDLLPAVLVEQNQDAIRGIEALRREGAGRCAFLAENNGHSARASGRISEGLEKEPGVLG